MSRYIDSDMIPIGKFLVNEILIRVPDFQRSYAWTDEEVKQLWLDLTEAIDTNQAEYFLGPMVIKKGKESLEIIDGQQRITTVLIILSVIRRIFRIQGDNQRADWFRNKYFGEQDILTLNTQPKFHMNGENDPIFQRYVVADTSETRIKEEMKGRPKKDSNLLLLQAVSILWDSIHERQHKSANSEFNAQELLRIHAFLQDGVSVLFLYVEDEADAYVIFETLNDRGRGLTTMDLLKNHIFGKAKDNLEAVKTRWAVIKDNLAETDLNERFLYHYWTSHSGRTSRANLFRQMRKKVTNPQTALTFVEEITEAARVYAALTISSHPFWNTYDQRTRENLETLNLLDAQQVLPILLASADIFEEEEFGKLTDIFVVMAVRYNLIGELRTGVAANYYVEIPPKIRSGALNKAAKVFRELKPLYPSDKDFEEAFSTKVVKNAAKARYLLASIEKHEHKGVIEIASNTQLVNLEHILPRNPSQHWKGTTATIPNDELDDYTYRLGNLALVTKSANKKSGSKDFETKKREIFAIEENIVLTKEISEYTEWTKATIEARQVRLAQIASKVWRIDIH